MAWPDISKRIWSYVIAKIGVFSNIDPSRLELGSKSISLTDIEIDAEKISIPGISVTQFSLEKLHLGISSSGLSVNGSTISIRAEVDTLETPDVAISMILESTKADLAQIGRPDESESYTKQSGYFAAKIADLVISQISARFSDVNIELLIPHTCSLHLNISEVFVTSKLRIEFESITLTKVDYFSDEDADELSGSSSEDEAVMSKSIYMDAQSSLKDFDKAKFESVTDPSSSLVAIIDRIIFTYQLDPISYHIDLDNAKIDALRSSELVISILNVIFSRDSQVRSSQHDIEGAASSFNLNVLEIYEALDGEANKAISLMNIAYSSSVSTFTVEKLDVPSIIMASPFLSVDLSEQIKVSILVPISIQLSLNDLSSLKSLLSQFSAILEELEPPMDTDPTPFILELPDMRVDVGSSLTIVVIPVSGDEKGIHLQEITARLDDSQLAMSDINFEYNGKLSIDSFKLNIGNSFRDEFTRLEEALYHADGSVSSSHLNNDQGFSSLPDSQLNIRRLEIIHKGAEAVGIGSLAFRTGFGESRLVFDLKGNLGKSETQLEFLATSLDRFRKSKSVLRVQRLRLDLDALNFKNVDNAQSEKRNNDAFVSFPVIDLSIEFDDEIYLMLGETMMIVHADISRLKLSPSGVSFHLPRLYGDLEDPSEALRRIPLIKIKDFAAKYRSDLRIDVGVIVFMCCADSYSYINEVAERLKVVSQVSEPSQETPVFIDTFHEVEDAVFVTSNLPSGVQTRVILGEKMNLDIEENYLDREQGQKLETQTTSLPDGSSHWDFEFTICASRVQWQIFDGFDFKRTRNRIKKAINEVTKVAANIEESSDASSDSAIVGDFMYGSVLISAPTCRATNLEVDVAKELGSTTSLERSGDPKVVATLRKALFSSKSRYQTGRDEVSSQISLTLRDGFIGDLVPTSNFNFVLWPSQEYSKRDFMSYTQSVIDPGESCEARINITFRPAHLSLDQDTVEFLARFFQFEDQVDEDEARPAMPEEPKINAQSPSSQFFRKFEFGGLPIIIDYMPKKLDYRSLRSGMAAELLNVFAVKGAKLKLQPAIFYGIDGWSEAISTLIERWAPDIKANQLFGLVSGITPIRKAVKVGKGVNKRTLVPIKQKEITKGAGIVVRRTLDELLRIATSWLDNTDQNLGED